MSRERLEDLGRVSEKLSFLCDHEIFDWKEGARCKDVCEWFSKLPEEKKYDIIHSLAYNLDEISNLLHDCYQVARWGDEDRDC
jgi:hypothetical protein